MSRDLTDRLHELDRHRRALRRRSGVEVVFGVAAVAIAAAAVGWSAALYFQRSPATPVAPDAPDDGQPLRGEPATPDEPGRRVEPRKTAPAPAAAPAPLSRHAPAPVRREPAPPAAGESARIGPFELTVDRALVTRRVLTEFFGIPATESDPALVVELRVTNRGAGRAVYRSVRGEVNAMSAGVTVVDALGMHYPALDYGAVPRGGVESVSLGPGGSVRDVLCFRAVERGVEALDLIIREGLLGPAGATLRIPPQRLVFDGSAVAERPAGFEPAPRPPRPRGPRPVEQPVEPAVDAAAAREFAALLAAADGGDPAAQVAVAGLYERGEGTRRDLVRAAGYYRMAAGQGDADGQWHVGRLLREGVGTASEPEEALRWLLKASMQDHRQAQWAAAQMLRDGEGVKQDTRQAARWLAELVRGGDRVANVELVALDPEAYMAATSRLRLLNTGPANEIGSAVSADGRLRRGEGGGWTLLLDNGRTVDVSMATVVGGRLKDGLFLEVHGVLEADGGIAVMHAVVPPARCTVTAARAIAPHGVVPYRQTRYIADVAVRNSGLQPIDLVTLEIQVRVISTASRPQTATVANLMPGETRSVRLEFSMFNPETVTSPACDVLSMEVDW